MTTAFVLSGGGSLGAVQVGMLQALAERGVAPDLLVGTSAGAINACFVAGEGATPQALERLAAIWASVRRSDIFPVEPVRHALALAGREPSLCSPRGLRRLLEQHLSYTRIEDATIPLHVVATDLRTGKEELLSEGDVLTAVLASTALPGVFPPVEREGVVLVDGAVSDNSALTQARALGADSVYLLPSGFACALERPPTTAIGIAMHSLTLLIEQRLVLEVEYYRGGGNVTVIPPLCPLSVTSTDFGHATELVARARDATRHWLDVGGPDLPSPARFLSLHGHDIGRYPARAMRDPDAV